MYTYLGIYVHMYDRRKALSNTRPNKPKNIINISAKVNIYIYNTKEIMRICRKICTPQVDTYKVFHIKMKLAFFTPSEAIRFMASEITPFKVKSFQGSCEPKSPKP